MLTLLSCDDDDDSHTTSYSGEGSITFRIIGTMGSNDILEATVYNQENDLQKSFAWSKDEIPEKIDAISAGPGKKFIVAIKISNHYAQDYGLISYRGESDKFNLNGGQTKDLGIIRLNSFSPKTLAPRNNDYVNGELINFEWEEVEGATQYRVIISSGNKIVDEIVSTTEYQVSNFCDLVALGENQLNLTSGSIPFPDTGQTQSYHDATGNYPIGQDSDYLTGRPDFGIFFANGSVFPLSYNRQKEPRSYTWQLSSISAYGEESIKKEINFNLIWGMTKDNNTGLVWEIKTDDASIHDFSNSHSWNESQSYIEELNNKNFGGISSWRLPTLKELLTIVSSGNTDIAIDKTVFYNCRRTEYWTSTYNAEYPNHVWVVDFSDGRIFTQSVNYIFTDDSIDHLSIRAVAGALPIIENPADRFTENDDGTITTDESTGLMWQNVSVEAETWAEALEYCESLIANNYEDWRLPNRNELLSIVDYNTTSESYIPNTEPSEYWTSTTYLEDQRYLNAWAVEFSTGKIVATPKAPHDDKTYYVRAVRGGI